MKKILLLLGSMLLFAQLSPGQTTYIGIDSLINVPPDTVSYGDSATYSFSVRNYGPNPFSGDIIIYTGVWDTAMTSVTVIGTDSTTLDSLTNFAVGDNIWVTHEEDYESQSFRIGTSVVVIWPVALNVGTVDSATYTIYLQSGLNILEVAKGRGPGIYPNPSTGKVLIGVPGEQSLYDIERVRISDASGRLLKYHIGPGPMDISMLKPGMYIIEVEFTNGTKTTYRVIRQNE